MLNISFSCLLNFSKSLDTTSHWIEASSWQVVLEELLARRIRHSILVAPDLQRISSSIWARHAFHATFAFKWYLHPEASIATSAFHKGHVSNESRIPKLSEGHVSTSNEGRVLIEVHAQKKTKWHSCLHQWETHSLSPTQEYILTSTISSIIY